MPSRGIYYEHFLIGTIEFGDADGFRYDPRWLSTPGAFPLSLSMPLRPEPFGGHLILPWLANLLPEGGPLIQAGRALGVAPDDVVAMLDAMGGDMAGALTFGVPRARAAGPEYRDIPDEASLRRILDELPRRPFLVGDDGIRMSLAGVQAKLAVSVVDGRIVLPIGGTPSSHILKPEEERLRGGVHNEAFCLVLARLSGLAVPGVTTGMASGRAYLLVERYDRTRSATGRTMRLHQEDFCQALGRAPLHKYERGTGGGVRAREMFAIARASLKPAEAVRLLSHFAFNILACNTDAHAKNYSILLSGPDRLTLSPLYDTMCAAVWPGITANLAQSVAGKNRGDHIYRRHWLRFARECGLGPAQTARRVGDLAARVLDRLEAARGEVEAMPAGPHGILGEVQQAIAARCRGVIANLADDTAEDRDSEDASATLS